MFVVSFSSSFLWQYTNIQHPVGGHIRVHIFNRPISDEPTKS